MHYRYAQYEVYLHYADAGVRLEVVGDGVELWADCRDATHALSVAAVVISRRTGTPLATTYRQLIVSDFKSPVAWALRAYHEAAALVADLVRAAGANSPTQH